MLHCARVLQRCVLGTAQGVAAGVCHEETAEEQSCAPQPSGPSVRRARHPNVHRQPVRRQLLLQF